MACEQVVWPLLSVADALMLLTPCASPTFVEEERKGRKSDQC
jgi:hypothetical protein